MTNREKKAHARIRAKKALENAHVTGFKSGYWLGRADGAYGATRTAAGLDRMAFDNARRQK